MQETQLETLKQLREAPLGGIRSPTPIGGFEILVVSGLGDQRRLPPGAVIAPRVIIVERLKILSYGNDTRTSCVDGHGGDLIAGNAGRARALRMASTSPRMWSS